MSATSSENQSAVIIPIPEVESIVGELRLRYDPAARLGVPAHITLLYPFCAPQMLDQEANTLEKFCRSIAAVPFSFTDVRRFPATAYLHPDKSEVFARITRALVDLWPQCRPYDGAFPDIVPHLTVADRVNADVLDTVEGLLRRRLPLPCVAREVSIFASDNTGMWSKRASFLLTVAERS